MRNTGGFESISNFISRLPSHCQNAGGSLLKQFRPINLSSFLKSIGYKLSVRHAGLDPASCNALSSLLLYVNLLTLPEPAPVPKKSRAMEMTESPMRAKAPRSKIPPHNYPPLPLKLLYNMLFLSECDRLFMPFMKIKESIEHYS